MITKSQVKTSPDISTILFVFATFTLLSAATLMISVSASRAQSNEENSTVIFQNGYSYEWLIDHDKTDHFEEFASQEFYAAFVANEDGDSFWYSGFHNLETARISSLAWCDVDKVDGAEACELVAYLIPTNIGEDFVSGLSKSAIEEYAEFQTYETFRAFALSANGAYAYAWEHASQSNANIGALEVCNESAEDKADWITGQSRDCVLFGVTAGVTESAKPVPKIKK